MTPGFQWHEYPREMYELHDRIPYILNLPLEAKPGEKFHYNSGLSVLLGGIIEKLEGENVLDFAEDFLFNPLGIEEYEWRMHTNGKPELWNGLHLKPRDMAKIGLLLLNDGKWQGEQIISKEWLDESMKPHASESDFFDYGYHWWLRTKNTKQWWKESEAGSTDEHDMAIALGWGSQFIVVVKDLNLVVVTTGSNFNNDKGSSIIPMIIEDIIPAISNPS